MKVPVLCGLFCLCAFAAAGAADDARRSDTPAKRLSAEEIMARPRRKTVKMRVPDDTRLYIGSGVYDNCGRMYAGGFCFSYWSPEKLNYDEVLDLCVKEGVGNTLQFWQSNGTLLELARKAKKLGLYSTCIYSTATNGMAVKISSELGQSWIGHDFGERFSFSLYTDWKDRGVTLSALAEEY